MQVSSNRYASTACPTCHGGGFVKEPESLLSDVIVEVECRACNGSGWVYAQRVCPCGHWRSFCACQFKKTPEGRACGN